MSKSMMSPYLDAAAWLSINFATSTDGKTRFDDIYDKCLQFYENLSIVPPTKEMISKTIPHLFGVKSSFEYKDGKRYVAYSNLEERKCDSKEVIHIPEYCIMDMYADTGLRVKVPSSLIVDGLQQYLSVIFTDDNTIIVIRDVEFPLCYHLTITQNNVDGMIHLLTMVKICQGIQSTNTDISKYMKENVSSIETPTVVCAQTRSKSCKVVLSFFGLKDYCDRCFDSVKQSRKRVSENQESVLKERNGQSKCFKTVQADNIPVSLLSEATQSSSLVQLCPDDHADVQSILERIIDDGAPTHLKLLLESQLTNSKKEEHQRRWDPKIISICLGIYIRSPRAYDDLKHSEMLTLPSQRLLRYYKNSMKQTTCFTNDNIMWMKKEADKQHISEFGHHGGIIIDEMSIQDDLVISKVGDSWKLIGFVDMDATNNNIEIILKGEKKAQLATHVLQFVFHGFSGFRWPVVYFGACPATTHQLYNTFWKCVEKLDDHGFYVDYVMTDGASTNRAFTRMLFEENPRDTNFMFKDIFYREHLIRSIQDIMHVLKRIRNNIESSKMSNKTSSGRLLILQGHPIVWDHWVACFEYNSQNGLYIHPNLTEEHFTLTPASKMRNKLATDVLNKSMLYLMQSYQSTLKKPEQVSSSIKLLEHTAVLTDVFCNINFPISRLDDPRIGKLRNTIEFFNKWEKDVIDSVEFIEKKNLITSETREDLNSAVSGFISLCNIHMKTPGTNSLNPGFVNSDIVENLFGQQRGVRNGLNTNPTLAQYGPSNTAIILSQCTVSKKVNSGKTASFFTATTPCALNPTRKKSNAKNRLRRL